MPAEIEQKAKKKIYKFIKVKGKIYEDLQVIQLRYDSLSKRVKAYAKVDSNPNGVLTSDIHQYIGCFSLQRDKLEKLLK